MLTKKCDRFGKRKDYENISRILTNIPTLNHPGSSISYKQDTFVYET